MNKQVISTFLLGVSAFASLSDAEDITVCPNSAYPTIQSGVSAAAPNAHVRVCAATYSEQVTVPAFKNGLSIEAQGQVVLRAPAANMNASYGFLVLAPGVSIIGFTITGYTGTRSAGIYVNNVNNAEIQGNVISGNCNGVLLNQSNNSTIEGNTVSQNPLLTTPSQYCNLPPDSMTITADGYGIQSKAGREVKIERNDLEQNAQTGVQLLDDLGGSDVSRNKLLANDSDGNGSALGNIDVRCDLLNCSANLAEAIQITDNIVDRGITGISLAFVNNVSVERNIVTNMNTGINVMDSNRNTIDHNTLSNNSGGNNTGLVLTGIANEISHNDFTSNDAGIFVLADACPSTYGNVFDHNIFENNPQFDITDATQPSFAGCAQPPPPANYTPGTFDFYDHNQCTLSIPSNICATK